MGLLTERLVVILLALMMAMCVFGTLPQGEKDALVGLYNATSGASWNVSWDLFNDPCDGAWKGVLCSPTNDTVIEIDLQSNNLNGTLVDLALPSLSVL